MTMIKFCLFWAHDPGGVVWLLALTKKKNYKKILLKSLPQKLNKLQTFSAVPPNVGGVCRNIYKIITTVIVPNRRERPAIQLLRETMKTSEKQNHNCSNKFSFKSNIIFVIVFVSCSVSVYEKCHTKQWQTSFWSQKCSVSTDIQSKCAHMLKQTRSVFSQTHTIQLFIHECIILYVVVFCSGCMRKYTIINVWVISHIWVSIWKDSY